MEQRRRENAHKVFVKVRADHNFDGSLTPYRFKDEEGVGVRFTVVDFRVAPSLRGGGQGDRYTCRFMHYGQERELYLYHDGRYWFVEKCQFDQIKGE